MIYVAQKNGIVLDLFAGSGTTAHAVINLNINDGGSRQFIICEQMDYVEDVTYTRVKKIVDALHYKKPVIYCELKQLNDIFIEKIKQCSNYGEIVTIINEMKDNAYLRKEIDVNKISSNMDSFKKLKLLEQKDLLLSILDKNMLYLSYSEIDDVTYGIGDNDKKFNAKFYGG